MKIFAMLITEKSSHLKYIHKNLHRLIKKSIRKRLLSRKMDKRLSQFTKVENPGKTNTERCSGIIIREMRIKATMRHDYTSINMAKCESLMRPSADKKVKQQSLPYMAGDTWGNVWSSLLRLQV